MKQGCSNEGVLKLTRYRTYFSKQLEIASTINQVNITHP